MVGYLWDSARTGDAGALTGPLCERHAQTASPLHTRARSFAWWVRIPTHPFLKPTLEAFLPESDVALVHSGLITVWWWEEE